MPGNIASNNGDEAKRSKHIQMITKTFNFTALEKNIEVVLCDTGRGISVTVAGGDSSHIGAVSIARPGEDVITEVFPTHKEKVISEKWAMAICQAAQVPTVVSCGIHYDGVDMDQIMQIVQAADEALEQILAIHFPGANA